MSSEKSHKLNWASWFPVPLKILSNFSAQQNRATCTEARSVTATFRQPQSGRESTRRKKPNGFTFPLPTFWSHKSDYLLTSISLLATLLLLSCLSTTNAAAHPSQSPEATNVDNQSQASEQQLVSEGSLKQADTQSQQFALNKETASDVQQNVDTSGQQNAASALQSAESEQQAQTVAVTLQGGESGGRAESANTADQSDATSSATTKTESKTQEEQQAVVQQQAEEARAAEVPAPQPTVGDQPAGSADSANLQSDSRQLEQQQIDEAIDQSMGFARARSQPSDAQPFGAKRASSGAELANQQQYADATTSGQPPRPSQRSKSSRSLKRTTSGHIGVFGRKAKVQQTNQNEENTEQQAHTNNHRGYRASTGATKSQQRAAANKAPEKSPFVGKLREADFPDYREILIQPENERQFEGETQRAQHHSKQYDEPAQSGPNEEANQQQQQQNQQQQQQQNELRFEQDKLTDSEVANDSPSQSAAVEQQSDQIEQQVVSDVQQLPESNSQQQQPYIRLSNIATINGTLLASMAGNLSGLVKQNQLPAASKGGGGEMKLMRIYVIDLDQKLVVGNGAQVGEQSAGGATMQPAYLTTAQPGTTNEYASDGQQSTSAEQVQAETVEAAYQTEQLTTRPHSEYTTREAQSRHNHQPRQQQQSVGVESTTPSYQQVSPHHIASGSGGQSSASAAYQVGDASGHPNHQTAPKQQWGSQQNYHELMVVDSPNSGNLSQMLVEAVQAQYHQQQQQAANSSVNSLALMMPHFQYSSYPTETPTVFSQYNATSFREAQTAPNRTGSSSYGNNLENSVAYPRVVVVQQQQQQHPQAHATPSSQYKVVGSQFAGAYSAQTAVQAPTIPLYIAPQYSNASGERQHYLGAVAPDHEQQSPAGGQQLVRYPQALVVEQTPSSANYTSTSTSTANEQSHTNNSAYHSYGLAAASGEPGQATTYEGGAWPQNQLRQQHTPSGHNGSEPKVTQATSGENQWRPVDTLASGRTIGWRPADVLYQKPAQYAQQSQQLQLQQHQASAIMFPSPDHDVVSLLQTAARGQNNLGPQHNYSTEAAANNYGASGQLQQVALLIQQQQQPTVSANGAYNNQPKSYVNSAPELSNSPYKQFAADQSAPGHQSRQQQQQQQQQQLAHPSSGAQYERPQFQFNGTGATGHTSGPDSQPQQSHVDSSAANQPTHFARPNKHQEHQTSNEAPRIPHQQQRRPTQPLYLTSSTAAVELADAHDQPAYGQDQDDQAAQLVQSTDSGHESGESDDSEQQPPADDYLKASSVRPTQTYAQSRPQPLPKRPSAPRPKTAKGQAPTRPKQQRQQPHAFVLQHALDQSDQNSEPGEGSGQQMVAAYQILPLDSGAYSNAAGAKFKYSPDVFQQNAYAGPAATPQLRPNFQQQHHQLPMAYFKPSAAKGLLSWETISSVASGAAKRIPGALSSIFGVGQQPKSPLYPTAQSAHSLHLPTIRGQPMKSAHYDRDVSNFHRPYPLRHMSAPETYSDSPHAARHVAHSALPVEEQTSDAEGDEQTADSHQAPMADQQSPDDLSSSSSSDSSASSSDGVQSPTLVAELQTSQNSSEVVADLAEIGADGKLGVKQQTAGAKLATNKQQQKTKTKAVHSILESSLGGGAQQLESPTSKVISIGQANKAASQKKRRSKKVANKLMANQQQFEQLSSTTLMDPAILSAAQASGQPLSLDQLPPAEQQKLLAVASKHAAKLTASVQPPPQQQQQMQPMAAVHSTGVMFGVQGANEQLQQAAGAHQQRFPNSNGLTSMQIGQYKITPQTQFVQSIIEPSRQMLGQYFKQYIGQLGQFG